MVAQNAKRRNQQGPLNLCLTRKGGNADDAFTALDWVRTHGANHLIDKNRVGAMGFSGGGSLAMMLGTKHRLRHRRYQAQEFRPGRDTGQDPHSP